ncbi:Uncharacterized protein dnl_35520 [Desulfonema limicola]|uniref:Uncharacterized protein n=1 Tax=Desulfonema limicola TaxID=45656 RepID=A0A975GHA6_9BACT|nr:hypothetical protein [Desulfonema limicola]QTA81221.1 Uncharacterized protein dnl_35520 [Desulfonema limicola]
MNCQKCKKEIIPGMEKKVADWSFCEDCFQELLNKPEKKAEEPALSHKTEKILCHLCKNKISEDSCKKTGIWKFCPECHASLNFSPKQKSGINEEDKELTPEEANRGTPEINLNPRFDFMKSEKCQECGRDIPVGGSRKVNGKHLCPECFYALPDDIKAQADDSNDAETLSAVQQAKDAYTCET